LDNSAVSFEARAKCYRCYRQENTENTGLGDEYPLLYKELALKDTELTPSNVYVA
jgi:hypothetical protein